MRIILLPWATHLIKFIAPRISYMCAGFLLAYVVLDYFGG